MTKKPRFAILLGSALCLVASGASLKARELPEAKVTVRVVDESRRPVSGVNVRLGFKDRNNLQQDIAVRGTTNSEGLFTGQGGSDTVVGSDLRKEGWYRGSAPIPHFRECDETSNRWLPWDATFDLVLRKVEHPIPMFVRRFRKLEIPAIGQPCGFDLEVSDWVAPFGKGKVSDFIMTASRRYTNRDDFDVSLELSFSNPSDGIQEAKLPAEWRNSNFIWPRQAPETGYEPHLHSHFGAQPGDGYLNTAKARQPYFFRVRSITQNGQIVSALYGKITGGIWLEGRETQTCAVTFAYYLNPTSQDRNMEWDPQRNLLQGLLWEEAPRAP